MAATVRAGVGAGVRRGGCGRPGAGRAARRAARTVGFAASAAAAEADPTAGNSGGEPEYYEAYLQKPLQVKFARGTDGGAYVVAVPAGESFEAFEVGDRIHKVSASFGDDIWDAESYGQVMYAMKTRNGDVYVKMLKRYGDMTPLDFSNIDDSGFRSERAGGNYGAGTQEKQRANYAKVKEVEAKRLKMFDQAIGKFEARDFEAALIQFEEIIGLEPPKFLGDNFATTTEVYRVSQYNAACCYSMMGNVPAGMEALDKALRSGFDDFRQVRTDPSLKALQNSDGFSALINKFDEPFINESAIKAFKNLFGGKN